MMMQGMGGGQMPQPGVDQDQPDTGEQIYISSLSLLKMMKHCRAGVPFEVMGLMVGEIVDEYTITVIDVFSMPQMGTTVSVESVDPVFQQEFMEKMKQVGREQNVVGWYHSHPGFGPWLSGTDIETQKQQENLNGRAVAVVVDPIQSVKGKVVIDAFRSIPQEVMMTGSEPRQTTSNIGHLHHPSPVALMRGLNKYYYSIAINYRKNEGEQKMLLNLHKSSWANSLKMRDFTDQHAKNIATLERLSKLTEQYNKWIQEETKKTTEEFAVASVGKMNPKVNLARETEEALTENTMNCLSSMLGTVVF